MQRRLYFVSHPNVVVSADVPVPQWPLSELGRARMHKLLGQPWLREVTAIYSSTEQKAIDGAVILARGLGIGHTQLEALGENDRSATGFLPPAEFERVASAFFAEPDRSVRGWETAAAAQRRIVGAVSGIAADDITPGAIAIVSHGAVGTLLYCHLAGVAISRRWDQPPNGGGNYYSFQWSPPAVFSWWNPIDAIPD